MTCQLGISACLVEGVLKNLGNMNTSVYDGSFQEWDFQRKKNQEADYSVGATYIPVPPPQPDESREVAWGFAKYG